MKLDQGDGKWSTHTNVDDVALDKYTLIGDAMADNLIHRPDMMRLASDLDMHKITYATAKSP
jgi:hypothetical protein